MSGMRQAFHRAPDPDTDAVPIPVRIVEVRLHAILPALYRSGRQNKLRLRKPLVQLTIDQGERKVGKRVILFKDRGPINGLLIEPAGPPVNPTESQHLHDSLHAARACPMPTD